MTPEFLVIAGEGGKAEYHLVDSQTGDMTTLTIPEPEGMEVAQLKAWGRNGSLGPNLVLGPDGTVALLAYFTPPGVEVKESWYEDGPPPEKGFLFGLDPATGEVAWQIEDIGDWRGLGAREGRNLWVTRDTVVRCGSEPDYAARVWDTSTGESPWGRSFDEHSRSLATHYGVIVFHDLKTLECLDMRTGDALWSAEMEVTGDVPSIWLEGETVLAATPSWVRGIDVRTGHDIFGVEVPEDGRVMASDAKDGVLRVRVEQKRGIGPEESVFLDLKTGDAVAPDLGLINATPHSIESYLFSVEPGVLPGGARTLSSIVPLFKAEGRLSYINYRWESRPTTGYLGQFVEEGCVLLTSFDEKTGTFHVYMLRPSASARP